MPRFEKNGKIFNNPVEYALDKLGGKWKMPILWRLRDKTLRYSELKNSLVGITHRMLSLQLKELETDGLIYRQVYEVIPPRVEYSLTEFGKTSIPVIDTLRSWGRLSLEKDGIKEGQTSENPLLERNKVSVQILQALTPEASGRRYFRIPERNMVFCANSSLLSAEDDFILIQNHLHKAGIPVPEIIDFEPGIGLLLQDLGNEDVNSSLSRGDAKRRKILSSCIELLVQIHSLQPFTPVAQRFFDREKLGFEIDLTMQMISEVFSELNVDAAVTEFSEILNSVARPEGWVVTHRDFHSRNIMVSDSEKLFVIDFQDARMGSPWYDLVSFVYDPYIRYSAGERKKMIDQYCKLSGFPFDANAFRQVALQRLHKALGTYLKFGVKLKMPRFLAALQPCLADLQILAVEYPALHILYTAIESQIILLLKNNQISGSKI
ncbi:MAG: winged helix-turn-helix transcriptional regulator [Leptospiraceae bacterium]|nr:winged helix-turn-helix transcriptional regulator [Leptospiraceae bacterium]